MPVASKILNTRGNLLSKCKVSINHPTPLKKTSLADIRSYEFVLCFDVKEFTPEVCPSTLDTHCIAATWVYTHRISTSGIAAHEL